MNSPSENAPTPQGRVTIIHPVRPDRQAQTRRRVVDNDGVCTFVAAGWQPAVDRPKIRGSLAVVPASVRPRTAPVRGRGGDTYGRRSARELGLFTLNGKSCVVRATRRFRDSRNPAGTGGVHRRRSDARSRPRTRESTRFTYSKSAIIRSS